MIREELKKTYFRMLWPLIGLLLALHLALLLDIIQQGEPKLNRVMAVIVLVMAALFSLGLPIFYRGFFASRVKSRKSVSIQEFLKFEREIIVISMTAPYFIVITMLLNLPGFYFAAVVIISLYAVYYYFPSERRIEFEKRLFRIREPE